MNEHLVETKSKILENCQSGEVIVLDNSSDLAVFEDEVAKRFTLDQESADNNTAWAYRKKLIDLIRPDDYFGPIRKITLSPKPDAYDRMFDTKERGKKYQGRQHPKVRTKFADKAVDMTIGFDLTFETRKGAYSAEVYYVPIAENASTGKRATSNTGGIINRYLVSPEEIISVAKPEVDKPDSVAKTIGVEAVQRCIPVKDAV